MGFVRIFLFLFAFFVQNSLKLQDFSVKMRYCSTCKETCRVLGTESSEEDG
jgi:hypothetical protein